MEKTHKEKSHDSKDDLVPINGCYLPPAYRLYEEEITNFEVFDSDIWVCTFPRSGTTWTSEMVWAIMNDCDAEKAKSSMFDRYRFLDMCFLMHSNKSPVKNEFEAIVNSISYTKNQPHPRIIKTHIPLHLLPKQIRNGEKRPKVVYVCRNPMDVCVSYYHHLASIAFKENAEFNLSLEDFCDMFLSGKVLYGPFWDHILPFWQIKDQSNILFLKYEELKSDLPGIIRKTAEFLGKTLSDDLVENLQKHLSFESMKENPSITKGKLMDFIKGGAVSSPFIRVGIVGGYKNEMSENCIKAFQKWMDANISGIGLTF